MGGVSYSAGAVVRVVLTVPGLWWAGAMGPDTHLLSSSFRFFPPGVRRVLSSYTPLGSIGLTHGSIGLTRWSIGLTLLSGSTPGALGDQPKILVRGRVVERIELGLHSLHICLLLSSYMA